MGNQFGNNSGGGNSRQPLQPLQPIQISPEDLRSYEAARQADDDVCKFDMELHARTTQAINALSASIREPLSFPLELLREVTGCFLDTDQEVVGIILSSKKDIWKNPELFSLVDDYFKTSMHTLEFCNSIEKFLATARQRQIILRGALQRLTQAVPGQDEYKKAIDDLEWFRSMATSFTEEMLDKFGNVYKEHLWMLQKLQRQRIQLDKKLKKLKSWRKTASIIFAATFITVLVCSIVATALAAPPLVTAIVAALGAAASFTPTANWFKKLWKGYEDTILEQRNVVSAIQAGTGIAILDLDNIKMLVERLEMEMKNLLPQVDDNVVVQEDGCISLVIQDIENKLGVFSANVDELGQYVDTCTRNIHQARTVILKRIMKPPNTGNETEVTT